jgi:GWxTD domain-containing protein
MKVNKILRMSAIAWIILFFGCGRPAPNFNRQNRFGSTLIMSARILNLPAAVQGKGNIVFIAEMRYSDLQFVKVNDGYVAIAEMTFSLQGQGHPEQVRLVDRRRQVNLKNFNETSDREKLVRVVEEMVVPVGEYVANVVVTDRYARSQGFVSETLRVQDFLSSLNLSALMLTTDSLARFQPDKLIPVRQSRFKKDFYTLFALGGLQAGQQVMLHYELQDGEGKSLFSREANFVAPEMIIYTSLPIPADKLSMGVTVLKIVAEQNGVKADASLSIYANVGVNPQPGQSLSAILEPMRYIMDGKDWQALENASQEERTKLFNAFWAARQPTTTKQEENPLLAEFFVRVQEANVRFRWTTVEGWKSDRGRIFIIYGEPDIIQHQRDNRTVAAVYEIWTYTEIGRKFWFYDYNNDGDFRLISGG